MKNYLFGLIAAVAMSSTAQAAMKFDLFVGGNAGTLAYKKTTNYSFTTGSVPAGFLLGYKSGGGFVTGLEYTYDGAGFVSKSSPVGVGSSTMSMHTAGLAIGYEGARFRVMAGYYPGHTINIYRKASTDTNTPDAFYGSAISATVGFRMGAKWALDLRYYSSTLTNFDYGSAKYQTITGTSTFNNVTNSMYGANLVYMFGGK